MAARTAGARALRAFAIVLVVLVVLLVVADRVGDYVAERVAASKIQKAEQLANRPDVDVTGIPFLTQLAAREFGEIDVSLRDLPIGGDGGRTLRVSLLRLVFRNVHVSRDFSTVRAGTGSATALVTYADVSAAVGVQVRYAGNGKVMASKTLEIAGQRLPLTVSTTPQLVNGALGFVATTVSGLGSLGVPAAGALTALFDEAVPIDGLPFDARVTKLQAEPDGVHLQLTGAHLSYSR